MKHAAPYAVRRRHLRSSASWPAGRELSPEGCSPACSAAERGVRVRVILELAGWNVDNSEENRDVWSLLSNRGIELYFDPIDKTSHSKLVVVDGKYVALGSTNWSNYSLDNQSRYNIFFYTLYWCIWSYLWNYGCISIFLSNR